VVDRNDSSAEHSPAVTSGQYVVHRGDTLYSIAFRYGWDWKALAARNNIPAPYTIRPGRRFALAAAHRRAVGRHEKAPPVAPVVVSKANTTSQTPAKAAPAAVASTRQPPSAVRLPSPRDGVSTAGCGRPMAL
jgi:lipoprotein NlpD